MRWRKREGKLIKVIQTLIPLVGAIALIVGSILTYRSKRGENLNVADKNKTDKYEVLDAKQEQIAEWGFKAADDANKRADRIAAEAQSQVAKLQEQLDALEAKLKEQTAALVTVRQAHARELAAMKADYEKQIDLKNRRIYALEDALKGQQGDRTRQTDEAVRQTDEAVRQDERESSQDERGKRQDDEDTRLNRRLDKE